MLNLFVVRIVFFPTPIAIFFYLASSLVNPYSSLFCPIFSPFFALLRSLFLFFHKLYFSFLSLSLSFSTLSLTLRLAHVLSFSLPSHFFYPELLPSQSYIGTIHLGLYFSTIPFCFPCNILNYGKLLEGL